jgi:NAD(P)-dependent dehydrogenase (short-subunit alcohol dehydrogenase family)
MTEPATDSGEIRLDGQTAVITGAGGGLGRAYAHLFAARGASVVVNDPGGDVHGSGDNAGPADTVVGEILEAGGQAVASYSSVATAEGGQAIIQTAVDNYGGVDVLVHNAGILRDRSFLNLTDDDIEDVLKVHLKGAFYVGRPAFALMKDAGYGRIVLTSSGSGLFGNFGQANYGAAKAGLIGLMRVLSVEGQRYGICINAVAPSARTRMTEELLGPLIDRMDPAHVAPLVAYLCSRECTFTSEIFSAGGGRYARVFLGLAPGWFNDGDEVAEPEAIRDRIGEIMDTTGFSVPASGMDEIAILLKAMGIQV